MKRYLLIITFVISGIAAIVVASSHPGAADYRIEVNGMILHTDENMEFRNLMLFIPLDASVLSALDAQVSPVQCAGDCFIVSAFGNDVRFEAGNGEFSMGDGRTLNAAPPYKTGDVYYIPAEAFFQVLGFMTTWDDKKGLLRVAYTLEPVTAQERLSGVLGLKPPPAKEETHKEATKAEAAENTGAAGQEVAPMGIQYTYENTIKSDTVVITGDSSQSRTPEVGDVYNQLNFRFMGTVSDGYDFDATLRTQETTDTGLNRGDITRLELSWSKGETLVGAGDVEPVFGNSKYLMRNNPIQGLNYKRTDKRVSLYVAAGKSPKELLRSQYARYVGGVRIEKNFSERKNGVMGLSFAQVKDTGKVVNDKMQKNQVTSFDIKSELGPDVNFEAEVAASGNEIVYGPSEHGNAALYKLNYRGKNSTLKNSYERTGSGFYSETASFTKSKTEYSTLYNRKLSPKTILGLGAKDKRIKDKDTRIYPASLTLKPFSYRPDMRMTLKRNFEKTYGARMRVIDTRELQIRDSVGSSKTELNISRQENKVPGLQLAYQNKRALTIVSDFSDRFGATLNLKDEKWKGDRVSVARQSKLKFAFEPAPWTEISLEVGRYYSTPKTARSNMTLGWHKINIVNDSEWKMEYGFENFMEYNINTLSVSYSFFR